MNRPPLGAVEPEAARAFAALAPRPEPTWDDLARRAEGVARYARRRARRERRGPFHYVRLFLRRWAKGRANLRATQGGRAPPTAPRFGPPTFREAVDAAPSPAARYALGHAELKARFDAWNEEEDERFDAEYAELEQFVASIPRRRSDPSRREAP